MISRFLFGERTFIYLFNKSPVKRHMTEMEPRMLAKLCKRVNWRELRCFGVRMTGIGGIPVVRCGGSLSPQEVLAARWWRAALCGCAGMRVCGGSGLGYRNHRIDRNCGGGSVGGGLRDGGAFAIDKIGYQQSVQIDLDAARE